MSKRNEPRDHWSEDEQIFFCDGKGYGVTATLQNICLGLEEDIQKYLETGEFGTEFSPAQRRVLESILDYRKEQGIGKLHPTGTAGLERGGGHGFVGHKSKATRLSQKRKRLPLRPPRTKNKGIPRR